ncbi:MAG: HEAT repeat domain-containing protein [Blastocatellia bacterium]|nr:HEAT repeat domain-containing protein [Blastocatellia bacterium]
MLLDAATGDDVKLRDRTLWMLENHQPIPEAIPVIEKMLEVRCLPLHTLCSLTQMMARITPRTAELRTQLQELTSRIVKSAQTLPVSERHWCFEALAWIGPEAIEAVPLCVATIEEMALSLIAAEPNQGHQDRRDRYEVSKAIKALGRLGSGAAASVPTLKRLLTGDELLFRLYSHDVIKALTRMGEPGITGLIEVLEECQGDWKEGYHWFEVDEEFKKIGPSVIPKLCVAKDCPAVRERLLEAAYLFGPEAAEAIPALQKLLSHNDPEVRAKACAALGRIGPAASGTAANLHVLAEDTVLEVRAAAIAALGKIGRPGLTALKQLFTASLAGDRMTQRWIVAALKPFQSMKSVSLSLSLFADSPDVSLRFLSGNSLD